MSSASELFYNRRSRIGRIDTELRFGSSSLDRNLHNNHRHSRRRHHQGQNVDDCDPLRRSPHVRHLCHREDESVHLDNGTSQSATGNSSHLEASSSRANRLRYVQNDRLPGAVLLARERLVERLRGVSLTGNRYPMYNDMVDIFFISVPRARERLVERLRGVSLTGNRQSHGVSSAISWDEVAYNDDFGLVDAGEWETETPREWFVGVGVGGTPFTDSSTQTDLFSTSMKPPGLSREEVNCLHTVVFNKKEEDDGLVAALGMAAMECSICLERFQEGDGLICLPCGHRFHSACLDPWVRTCGDCPYCRTSIILDHQKARKRTLATLH